MAIVDLSWAGYGFFYVYDHLSGKVIEWNAIQPLALKTQLDEQPLFSQSYFKKSAYQFDMQHANGVRYIQVTKHGEVQLKARIFCAGTDALSLCSFFSLSTLFDFLYSPLLITESNSSGDMTIKEDQIVNLQPK